METINNFLIEHGMSPPVMFGLVGCILALISIKIYYAIFERDTEKDIEWAPPIMDVVIDVPKVEEPPPPKPTPRLVKYTDFKVGKTYIVQGLTGYRYYSQVFEVIERTKIGLVVKSINLATSDRRVETFVIDKNCLIFQSQAHTYVTTQLKIEDFLPFSIGAFTVAV